MTRLVAEQIRSIPRDLEAYDAGLKRKTGLTLGQLAARALGLNFERCRPEDYRVAVIPLTTGLGIINGFSEAVCAIATYLGFMAKVTAATDAAGLVEAYSGKTDVAIMADDNIYAAVNLLTLRVADNDEATVRGYVTALEAMAGGLREREVLLIGAGRVGQKAAVVLREAGAQIIIFDRDRTKEKALVSRLRTEYGPAVTSGLTLEEALRRKPLIFDASPGEAFIGAENINYRTFAAAPGLPLGFTSEARDKLGERLIHDPLQIGTAVMLYKTCF